MVLNMEVVNSYHTILNDPEKYGFAFKPLGDCFEASEIPTPRHILFDDFLKYIKVPLPKVIFYIVMDSLHQIGKAPDGYMGYFLKLKTDL